MITKMCKRYVREENDRLKGEESGTKRGDLMIRMKVGNEREIKMKEMRFKMKEGQ